MVIVCEVPLSGKKFNVVTFPYMVQSLLINFVYHWINNNKNEAFNMDYLLNDIIKGRNYYLKKHNKSILDDTPFQEFRIQCMGNTIEPDRQYRLTLEENLANNKPTKNFRYDFIRNMNVDPDKIHFSNTSGNINNTNNKILIV